MEKRENIGAFYVLDDKRVVYLMGDKTLDDVNLDDLPVMETWPKDQDKFEQAFIYSEYIMSEELSEQFIRIMGNKELFQ